MMAFHVYACGPLDDFIQHFASFAAHQEARYNLMWGLMLRMRRFRPRQPDSYWAWVENGEGKVEGVALRTPGNQLVISDFSDVSALGPLIDDLVRRNQGLPGVLGPTPIAEIFASAWSSGAGCQFSLTMRETIYELTAEKLVSRDLKENERVIEARSESTRDWLAGWIYEFEREAMPEVGATMEHAMKLVNGRLNPPNGCAGFYVLEVEDQPRSVVGYANPTLTGIRIAPVYTPSKWRNQGYAGRLVAESCRRLFGQGYHRIFLFADKKNPEANAIYQKTGFASVEEVDHYQFVASPA